MIIKIKARIWDGKICSFDVIDIEGATDIFLNMLQGGYFTIDKVEDDEKDGSSYMFVDKGKLYYVNTKDGHALWSYDLANGTNEKVLTSSIAMLGNIDDTIIYKVNGEMGIYLYNVETKYMSLVTKRRVKEFVIDKYKEIKVVVE